MAHAEAFVIPPVSECTSAAQVAGARRAITEHPAWPGDMFATDSNPCTMSLMQVVHIARNVAELESMAIHLERDPEPEQKIGANIPVSRTNAMVIRASMGTLGSAALTVAYANPLTRQAVVTPMVPTHHPRLTPRELHEKAVLLRGPRDARQRSHTIFRLLSVLGRAVIMTILPSRPPIPPRLVAPADVPRWVPFTKEMPNGTEQRYTFPVWVNYQGFGAGQVVGGLGVITRGFLGIPGPSELYYMVQKLMPIPQEAGGDDSAGLNMNSEQREPFSVGLWAVPAVYCKPMKLAVQSVLMFDQVVHMLDDEGGSFSMTFLKFRTSTDPDIVAARWALAFQYPYSLISTFSAQLLTEEPDRYKDRAVLANAQDVLRGSPMSGAPASVLYDQQGQVQVSGGDADEVTAANEDP